MKFFKLLKFARILKKNFSDAHYSRYGNHYTFTFSIEKDKDYKFLTKYLGGR